MDTRLGAFIADQVVIPPTGTGALSGLTFGVKDVFAIHHHTSSAGNPDWLRTHGPSEVTASSISKLLATGASLQGMTHTDELMFSLNGQNEHYGTPINPKAPDRIPGGSSSGSAAAVAGELVDFALGTDTGGSVRIPSAYCGIYGMRPTHGLVAMDGVIPLAKSFDTVGWMARNPDILLKVGRVLIGNQREEVSTKEEYKRMLYPAEAWALVEPACRDRMNDVLEFLNLQLNAEQQFVDIAPEGLETWMRAFRIIQGKEIWSEHGAWIHDVQPVFGAGIKERFEWTSTVKSEDCEEPLQLKRVINERLHKLLQQDGLILIPTAPSTAPRLDIDGEANELRRAQTMMLSCIAGLSGLPQVTIPVGVSEDGAPIGLSIIAGHGQDLRLLKWIHQHFALWSDMNAIVI